MAVQMKGLNLKHRLAISLHKNCLTCWVFPAVGILLHSAASVVSWGSKYTCPFTLFPTIISNLATIEALSSGKSWPSLITKMFPLFSLLLPHPLCNLNLTCSLSFSDMMKGLNLKCQFSFSIHRCRLASWVFPWFPISFFIFHLQMFWFFLQWS